MLTKVTTQAYLFILVGPLRRALWAGGLMTVSSYAFALLELEIVAWFDQGCQHLAARNNRVKMRGDSLGAGAPCATPVTVTMGVRFTRDLWRIALWRRPGFGQHERETRQTHCRIWLRGWLAQQTGALGLPWKTVSRTSSGLWPCLRIVEM